MRNSVGGHGRTRRRHFATPLWACIIVTFALGTPGSMAAGAHSSTAQRGAVAGTIVVADLGAAARLSRLAAARDDLYVVDTAPGHVRRYILHGLTYAELFTQVMRWKEGADDLIMGRPLDLFLSGERLLILDSLGSLWSYWGPDYGRLLVPLRLQSNQGTPTAVALHGADLLLLDPARRRVWVYSPDSGGGYDTVPRSLTSRPLAALAAAARLAVTRDRLLTVLADGRVLAIPWTQPDAAVVLRPPLRVTGIWADQGHARFLAASSHQVTLLGPSGAPLWQAAVGGLGQEALVDVALSPAGRLYVLTQTRVLLVQAAVPS